MTSKTRPIAPERFALQLTIDQATRDKLVRAQALLRHRLPDDLADVLDRALDALLEGLERERFAATERPRKQPPQDPGNNPRHVPAAVRRAVHERDGEQCTFVSEDGRRCVERGFLERDHVTPVAVGGQPTIDGVRTLCRSHNQYEAERILGAEVVQAGRQRRRVRTRVEPPTATPPVPPPPPPAFVERLPAKQALDADTLRALRAMDVTASDARDALARSAHLPAETIEQRIRAALIALRTTYASRCSEPLALTWGWGIS